ncbi:hypothetical protein [Hyphomicrobium sp. 99]|uniref:hypothetical protein n=1 Tax=Hyphomicrobium sp. 99 TaxID=1163419 RepID=UPI0005F7F1BB|nr:hypothetical protein [Hyphomicrobium sp. 99]
MKFKALIVAGGVVAASAFSAPLQFGAGNKADAADAGQLPQQEIITVPEFVPILSFSQFVLATEQFVESNRVAAAEALSAKFAVASEGHQIEINQGPQPTPAIVESAMTLTVPDPAEKPAVALADPMKVATVAQTATEVPAAQEETEETAAKATAETETKSSATVRPRSEKRFRPAMGLGMPVDAEDDAMSSYFSQGKPKKKSAERTRSGRVASTNSFVIVGAPNPPAVNQGTIPKEAFQIGIPGQSMEPQISTCATRERTCWGKFCGC